MSQSTAGTLKKTALNAWHRSHGARMVEFAGWEMPVEYSGITEEHMAVRTRAGLFDVTHMSQIELAGPDALAAVQHITTNDAAKLAIGQAQYSALTTPLGTFVDDLVVYRLAADHFLMVGNAANTGKAVAWIAEHARSAGDVSALDTSARYALIALQGPASKEVLQQLTSVDLDALRYFGFTYGEAAGARVTISRTGFTGETGFELFTPPQTAVRLWEAILQAGRDAGVMPAGLGARDTLRLEAAMRLYGHEIDETTSVLEADLGWIVAWNKPEFNGRAALAEQRARGLTRKLVGFEMFDRAIARHGHDIYADGRKAGVVTSGTQTPFLKRAIGMAYVPIEHSAIDTGIEIDVRGRRARARVVPLPFYRRPRG